MCPLLDLAYCELFEKVIILPHFYRSTTFLGNAIFAPGPHDGLQNLDQIKGLSRMFACATVLFMNAPKQKLSNFF